MPLFLLSMLGGVKSCFTAVFGFLAKLNPWQLALLAACIYIVVTHFELIHWKHQSAKWQAQSVNYKRQLDAISSARNAQKVITRDRIIQVTRTIKQADKRAQKVENAPLPGGCRSPKQVLDADL